MTEYLYSDRQTGALVHVTTQRDSELDTLYDCLEFNEASIQAPQRGVVYYDGVWGRIQAVTIFEDNSLANLDRIYVDYLSALAFLEGRETVDDWFVGYTVVDRTTPQLLKKKSGQRRVVPVAVGTDWLDVPAESYSAISELKLNCRIIPSSNTIAFTFTQSIKDIELQMENSKVPFLITRRGDLSVVYEKLSIDLVDLLTQEKIVVHVQTDLSQDIGLFTVPAIDTELSFGNIHHTLPLPKGHFDDTIRSSRSGKPGPFVVDLLRTESKLVFTFDEQLHDGSPAQYDRDLNRVPVILVEPNDSGYILFGQNVSFLNFFSQKQVSMDIPAELAYKQFDVIIPMIVNLPLLMRYPE